MNRALYIIILFLCTLLSARELEIGEEIPGIDLLMKSIDGNDLTLKISWIIKPN